MSTLQELIDTKSYAKILELEGSKYNKEKIITLIKLEKFHEGLLLIRKLKREKNQNLMQGDDLNQKFDNINLNQSVNTQFEEAYILYKLKKYKKSLKILQLMPESEKRNILLSQVLYFLRQYDESYNTLSKCKYEKERDINLQAIEALSHSQILKKDTNLNQVSYDFGKLQSIADYNASFKDLKFFNQKEYLNKYEGSQNQRIQMQCKNLSNLLDENNLQGRKKDIVSFNLKKKKGIRKELIQRDSALVKSIIKRKDDILKVKDETLRNCLLFLKDLDHSEEVLKSVDYVLEN